MLLINSINTLLCPTGSKTAEVERPARWKQTKSRRLPEDSDDEPEEENWDNDEQGQDDDDDMNVDQDEDEEEEEEDQEDEVRMYTIILTVYFSSQLMIMYQ